MSDNFGLGVRNHRNAHLEDACRHFRGLVSDLYWSMVGLFLVGAWLLASPLLALYGSFRPTQLFKFLQWLRD